MTVGQIILLIIGIVLLFPGACSLFFIVALFAEKPSNLSDLSRGVTGEIQHVDAGYHIVGMKHP
jgi:hypothetical protein